MVDGGGGGRGQRETVTHCGNGSYLEIFFNVESKSLILFLLPCIGETKIMKFIIKRLIKLQLMIISLFI